MRSHSCCRVGLGGVLANAHLWVLEESVLVVDAASTAVLLWVLMSRPGATQPRLLPCLMDAQVGRVNQAALNDVRKVPAHVLEGHPVCRKALSWANLITPLTTAPQKASWTQHHPDPKSLLGLSFLFCKMGVNLPTVACLTGLAGG